MNPRAGLTPTNAVRNPHDRRSIADDTFPIFLDSGSIEDAEIAEEMGIVTGITTNPILLAREPRSPLDQLAELLRVFRKPILFQPGTPDVPQAVKELEAARKLDSDRVFPKLPARLDFVRLAADFRAQGVPVALTAVYTPGQALVAAAAGVDWVIPYVNRAKRLAEGGEGLVSDLAAVLAAASSRTRILAASIKSVEEAVQAILDGSHAISVSLEVLQALDQHALTDSAIEEFAQAAARERAAKEA
jgi:transaldolase